MLSKKAILEQSILLTIHFRYDGEDGFIVLLEPLWIRGIRFVMIASGRYVGNKLYYNLKDFIHLMFINKNTL